MLMEILVPLGAFAMLAATIAILALFEDAETQRQMLKVAVVPAVLGVVTLAYVRFARPRVGERATG